MKNTNHRYRLLSSLALLVLGIGAFTPSADARLIFTTEEAGVLTEAYSIDQDGTSTDFIDLLFGPTIAQSLRFDIANSKFILSHALDMGTNELKNFIVEKLASDPATCDGVAAGRMYYKTGTNEMLYCNGSGWSVLQAGSIGAGSITGTQLNSAIAADGLGIDGSGNLEVLTDGTTLEIVGDNLQIVDGGIDTTQLADDGVTAAKINSDVAGDGLTQNGTDGSLQVNADSSTLEVSGDALQVKADGITGTHLAAGIAGNGLTQDASGNFDIGTDDSTIELFGDALRLKDSGITSAKIFDGTIALADIAEREVITTLTPEYPSFTLAADGSANVGTLESDFDVATERNYYKWSTKQTSAQDYDIVIQWAIPENFQGWSNTTDEIMVDFKTDTTTLGDNKLDITLFDTAGVEATLTGGTDLVSTVADTWVDDHSITFAGGTWTPGEYMTMKIKMTSNAATISDLNPSYVGQLKFNVRVK